MAGSWFGRIRRGARLAYWRGAAARVVRADLPEVRRLRAHARTVRQAIDRVLDLAENRLTGPLSGSDILRRRAMTDWAWRPMTWRIAATPQGHVAAQQRTVLDDDLSVFHDCRVSELVVRQVRNGGATDLAQFGLSLQALAFDGTFLSVAVRLPDAAIAGLGHRHLLCADLTVESESPQKVFVALNIEHGPNIEKTVLELEPGNGERSVEFDLAHVRFDEKRVSKVWLDVFFTQPAMNRVVLRDLTVGRRPRAEL